MLKIGEFSKLTKTTIKALRYYDQLGLLKPAFIDSATSYRYYNAEQAETAQKIQKLKDVGLSCEKIQQILECDSDTDKIISIHREELEKRKAEITKQLEMLDKLKTSEGIQAYKPFIEHIGSCTVYCCRSFIKDVNHIMNFIKLSLKELERTNPDVGFPMPDYCCVIYPDTSYRDTNIFVEYVQSVDKKGTNTPTIKFKTLEEITAISVTHRGSYDNLRDAYTSAINYASANGYIICGNPRERYLKGAWNCDKTEDWETVVQLPVTKESL